MDRRRFIAVAPALALLGCAGSAPQPSDTGGMRFSAAERDIISRYYAQERRGPARDLPPQRVKPGDLLEPGQRPNKLPSALDQQLTYPAAPYTRLTLGADVILVNRDTHVIADVIPQVAY